MIDHLAARRHLQRVDPKMRQLVRDHPPAGLKRARGLSPYQPLVRAVARLGRADILPADDFGLRSGFRATYGGTELPAPLKLRAFGERWRPYRTVACWYLWRAADRAKEAAKLPKAIGNAAKRQRRA